MQGMYIFSFFIFHLGIQRPFYGTGQWKISTKVQRNFIPKNTRPPPTGTGNWGKHCWCCWVKSKVRAVLMIHVGSYQKTGLNHFGTRSNPGLFFDVDFVFEYNDRSIHESV